MIATVITTQSFNKTTERKLMIKDPEGFHFGKKITP